MKKSETTKAMIMDKAFDLFDRQGFHVTTMREIAAECGLTKAALYYHFISKKKMMVGILNQVSEQMNTNLYSIAYDVTAGTHEERLRKFFEWQADSYQFGAGSCFIGTMALEIAAHDEDYASILNIIFTKWEDALTHLYSEFHDSEKARMNAQQTIMEFEGAVMLGLVRKNQPEAISNAISHAMARVNN